MINKKRIKIKKEIKNILKDFEWKSEHSTSSELAELVIDMFLTELEELK